MRSGGHISRSRGHLGRPERTDIHGCSPPRAPAVCVVRAPQINAAEYHAGRAWSEFTLAVRILRTDPAVGGAPSGNGSTEAGVPGRDCAGAEGNTGIAADFNPEPTRVGVHRTDAGVMGDSATGIWLQHCPEAAGRRAPSPPRRERGAPRGGRETNARIARVRHFASVPRLLLVSGTRCLARSSVLRGVTLNVVLALWSQRLLNAAGNFGSAQVLLA